jgi:hypothetical protein
LGSTLFPVGSRNERLNPYFCIFKRLLDKH